MPPNPEVEMVADSIEVNDASQRSSQRIRIPTAKSRENQENQDSHDISSKKGSKPSSRATRTTGTNGATGGESQNEGRGDANAMGWQAVLEVMGNLREIVIQQQTTINELHDRLKETQEELLTLKHQELKQVYERLDALTKTMELSANSSPKASYAEVAQTPPNSAPANVASISSMGTTPSTMTDTLYCVIDTSNVPVEDGDKVSAGEVRKAVEKELRVNREQANWRCHAVIKDPKNPHRIRIACRDEGEQKAVKRAAETKIAPGVRVLRDELYPIKVDGVNRLAVLDAEGNIRAGATEAFSQENETTVAKIIWLSDREVPKAYGSMAVFVTKGSDARRLLAEGYFHAGGESGQTKVFHRQEGPRLCYNCQELGHKAFKCRNVQRCARCAEEGHHHTNCQATIPKCVPCGGPHESYSKNCPKLYPAQHE